MLPWTSPTKATSGVTFLSAGPRSPQGVSDRRPAPTKATPPGDQLPANLCPHKTTITRAHKNWGSSKVSRPGESRPAGSCPVPPSRPSR